MHLSVLFIFPSGKCISIENFSFCKYTMNYQGKKAQFMKWKINNWIVSKWKAFALQSSCLENKRGTSTLVPVAKNPPSKAWNAGSIPGQGIKILHVSRQLSPKASAREPACSGAHAPQLERSPWAETKTRCSHKKIFLKNKREFLGSQWLGLGDFTAMGLGSIPGWEIKILKSVCAAQK